MKPACIVLYAATVALAGCGGGDAPAATAHDVARAATATTSTPQTAEDPPMQIDCRDVRVQLVEGAGDAGAATTTRVQIERDGGTHRLESPPDMDGYVPVGIGCAQDASGAPYFVVEYGERLAGCAFCEWFFLYDGEGRLLNRSEPPLREEDGGRMSPNNDEYERRLSSLGLQHPQIAYGER